MSVEHSPPTRDEAIQKIRELTKGIRFAMLTTVSPDHSLHSRPMAPQELELDGTLWFFTGKSTHKTHEIRYDQHVNVAYASPDSNTYVSLSGRAQIVEDKEKAKELWNPAYRAWFPDGLDDPDLCLLKVEVDSAEYWDSPSSPVVHLYGLAKAMLTGKRADDIGDNEEVDLRS